MLFVLNHYLCNQEKGRLFIYHLYLLTEQSMNRQNDSPTRTKHRKEQFQYKPNHKFLKMKRLAVLLFAVAAVMCANAKILRVSNINGSTAPYSTVKAALEAAETGDVIMVDASPDSYGDVEINKSVTIQGPGYWLIKNGIVKEGVQAAEFGKITITADNAKVSSVSIFEINPKADGCVITRCYITRVSLGDGIKGAIIHQNYITSAISGPSYFDALPSNIQITNNIFRAGIGCFRAFTNSTIRYNTFTVYDFDISFWCLYNSTFEHNIAGFTLRDNSANNSNTYEDNVGLPEDFKYEKNAIDSDIKEADATISSTHGAFAGEDPYVISGIAPGPYIEDISVPASVEQGKDMKVTVKIGTSR